MAKTLTDTRREKRFRSAGRLQVDLKPIGADAPVKAELIDVNKFGGVGLFVPRSGGIMPVPLVTFLGGWKITRPSRKGKIDFTVRVFNAVPIQMDQTAGMRFSAMPYGKESAGQEDAKFFISTRRGANRISKEKKQVELIRKGLRLRGVLLNVGEDDGMGVEIDPPDLASVKWGEIFSEDWTVIIDETRLPCVPQRLGYNNGAIIMGIIAPGSKRFVTAGASAKDISTSAGDKALFQILDSVLKNSKTR